MHCACAVICVYSLTRAWWSPGIKGRGGESGCCRGSCTGHRRASFNNGTRFSSCPLQSKISLFAKFLHFSNAFTQLTQLWPNLKLLRNMSAKIKLESEQLSLRGDTQQNKSPLSHCFSLFSTWLTAPWTSLSLHQWQLFLLKFLRSQFVPRGSSGEDSWRPNNCVCHQMSSGCIQSHNVDVQDVCLMALMHPRSSRTGSYKVKTRGLCVVGQTGCLLKLPAVKANRYSAF